MAGLKTLLARVKRKILRKPFLKDKRYTAFWINKILKEESTFLVQIGSNDGKTGDPFFELLQNNKNWQALFVEPIPHIYERLQKNYPDTSRFTCENVAINNGKKMTFYGVDKKAKLALPDLPYWFDQLGSFNKNHILKHFDGALAPYLLAIELEGLTLPDLLTRNTITVIDILHIDTEGYDWKILSQLDLSKFQPRFILFEHNHLSQEERNASTQFLAPEYHLFEIGIDTLAVHKELGNALQKEMCQYLQSVT